MDREARDPFELMENIETILGIKTYPMNWPLGCGKEFQGVFDRGTRKVLAFESDGRANGVKTVSYTHLLPAPAPGKGLAGAGAANKRIQLQMLFEESFQCRCCGILVLAFHGNGNGWMI